jgi:predicted HAD superfamily Cof-like phosphohydrolase
MREQLVKHLAENLGLLNSLRDRDNPLEDADSKWCKTVTDSFVKKYMPYISEVEEFNKVMGKPNNYTPIIPNEDEWMFVYNFVKEELDEYKEACEKGDIVGVLDALCDITYVSLGNGALLHGLQDKIPEAYAEVQASNMSKSCKTEKEAKETVRVRQKEKGYDCHYEKVDNLWVVYRSSDRKVQKSINYFPPNLKQFLK